MGLDMYLNKRVYIGAEYEHRNVKGEIQITTNGTPIDIKFNRVSEIIERVGYWRKANHIHNWFVNNVQSGKDDCGEYYVSEDQLKKLLSDCKKVKEDKSVAADVLPTLGGFFFGGTEYDEYYMYAIDNTIEIIETILSETNSSGFVNGYIEYTSSW